MTVEILTTNYQFFNQEHACFNLNKPWWRNHDLAVFTAALPHVPQPQATMQPQGPGPWRLFGNFYSIVYSPFAFIINAVTQNIFPGVLTQLPGSWATPDFYEDFQLHFISKLALPFEAAPISTSHCGAPIVSCSPRPELFSVDFGWTCRLVLLLILGERAGQDLGTCLWHEDSAPRKHSSTRSRKLHQRQARSKTRQATLS